MKNSNKYVMAALAAFVVVFSGVAIADSNADATISGDYGDVFTLNMAVGGGYTWTPQFDESLTPTLSIEKKESGLDAKIVGGNSISIKVNASAVVGQSYDVVLKATTDAGTEIEQNIYKHFRVVVKAGLQLGENTIAQNIFKGASIDFTPVATNDATKPNGDAYKIAWSVVDALPTGLQFDPITKKLTGTATDIGLNTVKLKAESAGMEKTLTLTFNVFNTLVEQSDETIKSFGNQVESHMLPQKSDVVLNWAVASDSQDQIPSDFSIDPATGVISGNSSVNQTSVVKIEGTHAPTETKVSKTVTIVSEPLLKITPSETDVIVYPGMVSKAVTLNVTPGTSKVTFTTPSKTGISLSGNTLTIADGVASGKVTVTAKTVNGQEKTADINITVEEKIEITGPNAVSSIVEKEVTQEYTCNVPGVEWSIESSIVSQKVSIDSTNGVLKVNSNNKIDTTSITIKATNKASGQFAEITVDITVKNKLTWENEPTTGAIIYAA